MILLAIGAAGEVARLLHSDQPLSIRTMLGRMLIGGIVSLSVLAVRVHKPDAEDLTLVGLGAVVAVLGYSALEPVLRRVLRLYFRQGKDDETK